MTGRRPPGTIMLLWCPACGATRSTSVATPRRVGGAHVSDLGGTCLAQREVVEYVLPRVPEPLPALADGAFRAAVAVEVAVRPGLQHLDASKLTFVGRTVQYHAHTVEQLAELAALFLTDIAEGLPDALAPHPRPAPAGWAEGLLPEREWRREYGG